MLEWPGHVEPTDKDLSKISAPNNKAQSLNVLKGLGVDYLVTGNIAIIEKNATLEIKVMGSDGNSWQKKGQMEINEITPWLDPQSKAIMGDVFHRPGYTAAETAKSEDDLKRTAGPTNSAFIMAQDDHYKTDTLNPQFRYEGGTENIGRWRSQTLRFSSYSMVVTDGDGDGKNEIFILQKEGIAAYREKEGKLALLDNFKLASNLMNIRLEAADLDKDGLPEFIIGAYQFEPKSGIKAPEGPPSR